jgi:hypothetical protein
VDTNVAFEIARLQRLTPKELRVRYAEVFGEDTPARNKAWLLKRLAWRLQSLAEGGLAERARRRADELANDADLRMNPPQVRAAAYPDAAERTATLAAPLPSDDRLPPPGTVLTRLYKGDTVQVRILPDGFEYQGHVYGSLSAVAKAVTGSHCNGFLFFKLNAKGDS